MLNSTTDLQIRNGRLALKAAGGAAYETQLVGGVPAMDDTASNAPAETVEPPYLPTGVGYTIDDDGYLCMRDPITEEAKRLAIIGGEADKGIITVDSFNSWSGSSYSGLTIEENGTITINNGVSHAPKIRVLLPYTANTGDELIFSNLNATFGVFTARMESEDGTAISLSEDLGQTIVATGSASPAYLAINLTSASLGDSIAGAWSLRLLSPAVQGASLGTYET